MKNLTVLSLILGSFFFAIGCGDDEVTSGGTTVENASCDQVVDQVAKVCASSLTEGGTSLDEGKTKLKKDCNEPDTTKRWKDCAAGASSCQDLNMRCKKLDE